MKSKIKKVVLGVLLLTYIVLVIAQIVKKTGKIDTGTDFYAFWAAGNYFLSGQNLYDVIAGESAFIYPPPAAFFFQFFAWFSYPVATSIFLIFNAIAPFISAWLIFKMLRQLGWDTQKSRNAIIFSTFLAINYFWGNLRMNQVNHLIFILILAGIYLQVHYKGRFATIPIILGAAIKILPIVFLPYFILKNFRLKPILLTVTFFLLIFILPILQRGWDRGLQDYQEYYNEFLVKYQSGVVHTTYTNQNLAGAIYRWSLMPFEGKFPESVSSGKDSADTWIKISYVLLVLIYLHVLILSRKDEERLLLSTSIIMLIMHLISGITWKAHLVTFQWIFIYFVSLYRCSFKQPFRFLYYILLALAIICGLETSDLVGWHLHKIVGFHNTFVWLMLLLLLWYYAFLILRKNTFLNYTESTTKQIN